MNRIKLSEFPLRGVISSTEQLVAVVNGENYLIDITDIPQVVAIMEQLDVILSALDDKLSSVVVGIPLSGDNVLMTSDHQNAYLSFTNSNTKYYTVVSNDGFPQWGITTIRNSADTGNLIVTNDVGVTLDGNQANLTVPPKGSLQLIKADDLLWHIL